MNFCAACRGSPCHRVTRARSALPRAIYNNGCMTRFDDDVVTAVMRHMNDDHSDDNLLIVRAFAKADATAAVMTDLDKSAGYWEADGEQITIPWPIEVTERPHVRLAVVKLYEDACDKLGVQQREH